MSKVAALNKGTPTFSGVYAVYVDDPDAAQLAKRDFLMWHDGRWSYPHSDQNFRGVVHGWIGPLPGIMKGKF
jgi:hypothetical protein